MTLREPTPGTPLTSGLLGVLLELHANQVTMASALQSGHSSLARAWVGRAVSIENALAVAGEHQVAAELAAASVGVRARDAQHDWPHPLEHG